MQAVIVTESTALIAAIAQGMNAAAPLGAPTAIPSDGTDGQNILALLRKGRSCRAIAVELGVCVPTIKARLVQLYRQAGKHTRPR